MHLNNGVASLEIYIVFKKNIIFDKSSVHIMPVMCIKRTMSSPSRGHGIGVLVLN